MSDLKELWTGHSYIIKFFKEIFKTFVLFLLTKKKYLLFFLNINYYFYLFYLLSYNSIININTIIDIVATHYPGFDNEFELLYVGLCYNINLRFFSKLSQKKENLLISLSNLFNSASWLEREIWDLFGLKFIYHKDLRRILTDYGFLGHPLLKQFPLIGFIELRYDDTIRNIIKEAVEMSQVFRFFRFINPWTLWQG